MAPMRNLVFILIGLQLASLPALFLLGPAAVELVGLTRAPGSSAYFAPLALILMAPAYYFALNSNTVWMALAFALFSWAVFAWLVTG